MRNTLNFTLQIYFHLDDSPRWKQYQSVNQEMMEQICDLETVKPQKIPIKVCVIFYNIEICYRGCVEKKKQACNFIKIEALAQVFSCEFCKISKNTFLAEHF